MKSEAQPIGRLGLTYEVVNFAAVLRGIDPQVLLDRVKKHEIAHIRFAVIWAMRELNPRIYTYPLLAKMLGFQDHTSIMHGYRQVCTWRDTDYQFKYFTDRLLAFAVSRAPYARIKQEEGEAKAA